MYTLGLAVAQKLVPDLPAKECKCDLNRPWNANRTKEQSTAPDVSSPHTIDVLDIELAQDKISAESLR